MRTCSQLLSWVGSLLHAAMKYLSVYGAAIPKPMSKILPGILVESHTETESGTTPYINWPQETVLHFPIDNYHTKSSKS